jgi:transcription antitermination factor NusG
MSCRSVQGLSHEAQHPLFYGDNIDGTVAFNSSDSRWFAVWTRSRQEKVAATMLEMSGVPFFLPLKTDLRQWSDRRQPVSVPLFSGYLFVRMNPTRDTRLRILNAPGVAGLVGNGAGPWPIPDQQIEDIRKVLSHRAECSVAPILKEGDLVRVRRGPLTGVEGRLSQNNSTTRLLISIESINMSLAINLSREDVELAFRPPGLI